jgi:Family of unknown function (DUF6093)
VSIESILTEGRQAAEARMYDVCVITHATTEPTWNPVTNHYDTTPSEVYTGKCRVKLQTSRLTGSPDAGERTHVVLTPEVHIPASVAGIGIGDEVTITAALFNVELTGTTFRVTSLFRDSQATAQRLDCTEVQQ